MSEEKNSTDFMAAVRELLARQMLVEDPAPGQDDLEEEAGRKQYQEELRALLDKIPLDELARIVEALEPEERLAVWY